MIKKVKGLTLIELMLATGIAVVTLLGMVHYLNLWIRAQAQQQQTSDLQLKALKALSVLEYDLKRVGFFARLTGRALHQAQHFAPDNTLFHLNCSAFDQDAYLRWIYPLAKTGCALPDQGQGFALTYLAQADASMPYNRQVVCEKVNEHGQFYFSSMACNKKEVRWYFRHVRYFIRQKDQPKLYVQWLSSRADEGHTRSHLNTQVKAEGVERLVILYGLGRKQDEHISIESYQTLDQSQPTLWSGRSEQHLIAIQIQVVVRSEHKAVQKIMRPQPIALIDGGVWAPQDDYLRLSMTRLIPLKHLLY